MNRIRRSFTTVGYKGYYKGSIRAVYYRAIVIGKGSFERIPFKVLRQGSIVAFPGDIIRLEDTQII